MPGSGTLLTNAVILPMDGTRRIIDRGHVVVRDGRIVAVGPGRPDGSGDDEVIDLDGAVLIPGLIDLHLHAGHGLTKGIGGSAAAWMAAVGDVYALHADADFWGADAALQALERTLGGVTTAVPFFGGGDNVMASHDPACADAHLAEVAAAGLREILVLGVDRPPFPRRFRERTPDGGARDRSVHLADQIAGAEATIRLWSAAADGRIDLAVSAPVGGAQAFADATAEGRDQIAAGVGAAWDLARRHGLRFVQDGHRDGTIAFMADTFGLFDATSVLAHCIDLTPADVAALERTGAGVAYTPSSLMSVFGTCPAVSLRSRGVRVGLGTDGPAPDRSLDMFRTMFMAHRVQAIAARDETVLDAWDMLAMATCDAAAVLGRGHELGCIAPGYRADLAAVRVRAPHLWPPDQPAGRLAFYAHAGDVVLTMVDGRVLMRDRTVRFIDTDAVFARAADAYGRVTDRLGISFATPR